MEKQLKLQTKTLKRKNQNEEKSASGVLLCETKAKNLILNRKSAGEPA